MRKLLVTGSEGLLGRHLIPLLLSKGYSIREFDIAAPERGKRYGDVRKLEQLKIAMKDCVGVIHYAAISRVVWGKEQPILCWDTNVIGTHNIVEAANSQRHKPWILYAGSREVYGQQETLPVKESAFYRPVNQYARSKLAAELITQHAKNYGIQTSIVRYSNVYGWIGDHDNRVVPAFSRAAALGQSLFVEGKDNVFDFTHVSDVVRGTVKVIDRLENKNPVDMIHLVGGRGTTLQELAEIAIRSSRRKSSKILYKDARDFDVASFYGDPDLATRELGWQVSISLEEGVAQFVSDFEKYSSKHECKKIEGQLN